jgi:hypothetical protein
MGGRAFGERPRGLPPLPPLQPPLPATAGIHMTEGHMAAPMAVASLPAAPPPVGGAAAMMRAAAPPQAPQGPLTFGFNLGQQQDSAAPMQVEGPGTGATGQASGSVASAMSVQSGCPGGMPSAAAAASAQGGDGGGGGGGSGGGFMARLFQRKLPRFG